MVFYHCSCGFDLILLILPGISGINIVSPMNPKYIYIYIYIQFQNFFFLYNAINGSMIRFLGTMKINKFSLKLWTYFLPLMDMPTYVFSFLFFLFFFNFLKFFYKFCRHDFSKHKF